MKSGHMVLDLKKIFDRCEEEGDCLLWQQGVNSHGIPFAQHLGKITNVRRLVLSFAKGVELSGSLVAIVRCGNKRCLNHEHILAMTRGSMVRRLAKAGMLDANSVCDRRRAASRTRPSNKINEQIAEQIRLDGGSQAQRALKFGVSQSLVAKIDRGVCWQPEAQGFSVFNMVAK